MKFDNLTTAFVLIASVFLLKHDSYAQQFKNEIRPILAKHCFQCHGSDKQESKIRFDNLSTDLIENRPAAETWHDALTSLDLGEMPPDDQPDLSPVEHETLTTWIRQQLKKAEASKTPNIGSVVLRRLNRIEYQNTMVDLLGVDLAYSTNLPPDTPSEQGFQNNGAALTISPMALEFYLAAARDGLSKAIVTGARPQIFIEPVPLSTSGGKRKELISNHLGLGEQFIGKLNNFPNSGEFRIRVTAQANLVDGADYPRLKATLGYRADTQSPNKEIGTIEITSQQPGVYEFRGRMEDFPIQSRNQSKFPGQLITLTNVFNDGKQRKLTRKVETTVEKNGKLRKVKTTELIKHTDVPTITIQSVEFTSPLYESWPPNHHQTILFDSPTRDISEQAYAREVIGKFMQRAFRRPVLDWETDSMLELFAKLRKSTTTFEEAIRETLALILVSPDFLFLVETAKDTDSESELLTSFELASRLSYFLWSTMPDQQLYDVAASGTLMQPNVLAQEVERMLGDPKSSQFIRQFSDQWLDLASVNRVAINPQYYEQWDTSLEPWMQEESRQFFAEILQKDLSALNFIDSEFAMLNAPMARHYGIDNGPRGVAFERVQLPEGSKRGGLLGQASILLGNSTGEDSHPILRGVWVRERLLNDPPDPPPPNVPALESNDPKFNELTVREQLKIHRQDVSCAACHRRIDPWGLALEHFDAVGQYRTNVKRLDRKKVLSVPVQAETVLPSGEKISGATDLKNYLLQHRSKQFAETIATQITSYAIGRSVEFADKRNIESITTTFIESGYRLQALIQRIVQDPLFQSK
ncbi:MAG: DUF1592 domain-containing protein [Planctomycetaceae bacterium]|nr:DUF1592 domain-containing protein [Planctomycetaceae bacterium]